MILVYVTLLGKDSFRYTAYVEGAYFASAEGIDTAITNRQLPICFLD